MKTTTKKDLRWLYLLSTPIYGTTTVSADHLITEIRFRIRHAKVDNKHFGLGMKHYDVAADKNGSLWLVGY